MSRIEVIGADGRSSTGTADRGVIVAHPRGQDSYHDLVTTLVAAVLDGNRVKARQSAVELRQAATSIRAAASAEHPLRSFGH